MLSSDERISIPVTLSKAKNLSFVKRTMKFFTPTRSVQNDILSSMQDAGKGSCREMSANHYYVFIMTNRSRTLYTGVNSNLERRVFEHKNHLIKGFTGKYNITKLVYYEMTNDIKEAIAREKQIKGWLRSKKIALVESMNPEWRDLAGK